MSSEKLILGLEAPDPDRPSVFPAPGPETTNVMIHYYRGEIGRMSGWRNRIDQTTNWAITVVAAMLSVALSTPTAHHGVLLMALLLISLLLFVEARRYRFFDVYRTRVRQIERHYFAQVYSPIPSGTDIDWMKAIGQSLRQPTFHMTLLQALSRRIERNYFWMYAILLVAWLLKLASPELQANANADADALPSQPFSIMHMVENAAFGAIHGWLVLAAVIVFYGAITFVAFRPRRKAGEFLHGDVHV
jgi:uncharacterized membrane protein